MNLLNKLTLKNLKLNKKRTIVTIIGIILSVSLITAVASIYTSGIKSLISFEKYEKGNFHVVYYDVPQKDLYIFENNREIAEINLTKNIGYAKINSKNADKPYAYLKAFTKNSLDNLAIRLVEGRLPQNSEEIVIPSHLKTNGRLSLEVGSLITLDIGQRINLEDNEILGQNTPFLGNEDITHTQPKTYKIVGIIERPASSIESYTAPGYTFITVMDQESMEGNVDVFARYTKDGTKKAYELTAGIINVNAELLAKYYENTATHEEELAFINIEKPKMKYAFDFNSYLIDLETDPLGIESTGGLAVVALIVMGIIIITSIFCIKNSFDISITEKIKQYGMLRSIGATKKQIKHNVFYEATILGLIGIPLGIFFGLVASYILIIVSNYFLKDSLAIGLNLRFSFSFLAIVIAIILGSITIYFSAFRSARRASKTSPIESIRNSAQLKINSKKIKAPRLIHRIFGMGGVISYKNLKRNKKKYRTTVISIIVSVFVFIALSSFMNMAFDELDHEVKVSEYNLNLYARDVSSEESYNKFASTTKLNNIENYTILRNINFTYNNRQYNPEYVKFLHLHVNDNSNTQYIHIYALGDEQYQKYLQELGLQYEDISTKAILMDYMTVGYKGPNDKKSTYKTMRLTASKKGDILTGTINDENSLSLEVGYITSQRPFGLKDTTEVFLIISDELYNQISLPNTVDNYLYIFYKSNNANNRVERNK